jgi:hypothetical protein
MCAMQQVLRDAAADSSGPAVCRQKCRAHHSLHVPRSCTHNADSAMRCLQRTSRPSHATAQRSSASLSAMHSIDGACMRMKQATATVMHRQAAPTSRQSGMVCKGSTPAWYGQRRSVHSRGSNAQQAAMCCNSLLQHVIAHAAHQGQEKDLFTTWLHKASLVCCGWLLNCHQQARPPVTGRHARLRR